MAYLKKNTLVARPGYGTSPPISIGSWTDTVGDLFKGAITVIGAQQRAAGGQEALQQALAQQQALAAQQSSGIDTTTLLVGLGVVGVGAYLLLRKKKG